MQRRRMGQAGGLRGQRNPPEHSKTVYVVPPCPKGGLVHKTFLKKWGGAVRWMAATIPGPVRGSRPAASGGPLLDARSWVVRDGDAQLTALVLLCGWRGACTKVGWPLGHSSLTPTPGLVSIWRSAFHWAVPIPAHKSTAGS